MRTSTLLTLGATSGLAMATVMTNTFYQTTTVTVVHCEPTHTDCIGGSVTVLTTVSSTECLTTVSSTPAPVVETSTSTPVPTESTPAPVPTTSEVSSSAVEVPSTSAEAPSSTYEVPSSTAEVPSSTSSVEGAPSSTVTASIETGSTEVFSSTMATYPYESYVPVETPAYSNTSEPVTSTSSPTTTTAVVVTTPASSSNSSPTVPAPSATQTGISGASNVVVPGFTLVLLALGAYLFG